MAAAHGTPQHVDTEILRSGEEMADINRDYRDDTNLSIPESECCVAVNSYAKKFSDTNIIENKNKPSLNSNSYLTLRAGALSVKKVADSAPKPESRVQLSAWELHPIFSDPEHLTDRSRSHETVVTALSITVRKLHPSIELSSLFPSVKFKAMAGMLVAVALCLAAYTVSDSHQSEQQLRSQALGSCLLRAKEDPFRAPVSDQWQQLPDWSRPIRALVSELSAISVLETWTPEPGPGRCLHGVRAPRHEGAALLCSGSHQ